jgi:DNA polymerase delta subunit 2
LSDLTISNIKDPKFVMFVSGLSIDGDMNEELALSSQLLVDFVSGRLGGEEENKIASHITRVIVSGNSMSQTDNSNTKELRFRPHQYYF